MSNHIPFRIALILDEKKDNLANFLNKKGIEVRTFFYPLHKQPCYKREIKCPNSEYLYEHGLCLPSYPSIKEEEINYVCASIGEYYDL